MRRFLVCAPNTALGLPAGLEGGTKPLREEIEAYLREQGREVAWLDLHQGKQLLNQAIERAKAEGDIGRAPSLFTAELSRRYDFQALVMPSILLHSVRTHVSSASWDGVSRQMRTVNAPRRPGGRSHATLADGIAQGGLSGDMPVTSLHIMVFSAEGERIFESRGGLEFLQEIDIEAEAYRFRLRLRSDLFQDREILREGVEIAFTPYLTPLE